MSIPNGTIEIPFVYDHEPVIMDVRPVHTKENPECEKPGCLCHGERTAENVLEGNFLLFAQMRGVILHQATYRGFPVENSERALELFFLGAEEYPEIRDQFNQLGESIRAGREFDFYWNSFEH